MRGASASVMVIGLGPTPKRSQRATLPTAKVLDSAFFSDLKWTGTDGPLTGPSPRRNRDA